MSQVDLPGGLGSRHLSLPGITQATRSIGVVVSQSGGPDLYLQGRKDRLYHQFLKERPVFPFLTVGLFALPFRDPVPKKFLCALADPAPDDGRIAISGVSSAQILKIPHACFGGKENYFFLKTPFSLLK